MRRWIDRKTSYGGAHLRGLGIELHWGTTGSTYGEPGQNMFLTVSLGLWWIWNINFAWKRYRKGESVEERKVVAGEYCDECGNFIPDREEGGLANRHHQESCSLYDKDKE